MVPESDKEDDEVCHSKDNSIKVSLPEYLSDFGDDNDTLCNICERVSWVCRCTQEESDRFHLLQTCRELYEELDDKYQHHSSPGYRYPQPEGDNVSYFADSECDSVECASDSSSREGEDTLCEICERDTERVWTVPLL